MNSDKNTFSFDRIEWEKLSTEEQEKWFDWAEDCGAKREVQLAERNSYYPAMICVPAVSLGISAKEILDILDEIL
jgi:hypothetical protein